MFIDSMADPADMENVRNFTRTELFISRFYQKVHELRKFQNRDKTVYFQCKYIFYNIYVMFI